MITHYESKSDRLGNLIFQAEVLNYQGKNVKQRDIFKTEKYLGNQNASGTVY